MVFLIMGSADAASDGKERRGAIGLLHALPILHFVVFIIAFFFVFQFGAIELKLDEAPFWVLFVLWALMCAMLWITLSFKARNAKIPEKPDEFSAQKRHAVRLFDDASHYRDPDAEPGQPDRYFPSGRRPIMRLWWEGTGKMAVRSDRYGLVFKLEAGGSTTEQELPAPVAPMTPTEYLDFLIANLRDRDGSTNKLRGSMMSLADEENYELPPGATFAAHGDTLSRRPSAARNRPSSRSSATTPTASSSSTTRRSPCARSASPRPARSKTRSISTRAIWSPGRPPTAISTRTTSSKAARPKPS